MKQKIEEAIEAACKSLYGIKIDVVLERPEEKFGDFATNVAMHLTTELKKSPKEIAEQIVEQLTKSPEITEASVAGPGFINIRVSDDFLLSQLNNTPAQSWKGKVVVCEYSDPNPFKVLHAGHLYTSVVGDCIANLYEEAGAVVHRVNFGGDVGLHVGKTMWAILQKLGGDNPDKLNEVNEDERSGWLGKCYIEGTAAYEDKDSAKAEIIALNKRVYQLHYDNDHKSQFAQIYWVTRKWSYDYFDEFYARIGTKFEKYYPESSTLEIGLKTVEEQLKKGVFERSDGAVIFKGENHGLYTNVFINSEGLPTYSAKDIGLIFNKWNDYHFDKSIVITGNEQEQYMSVVLKAVEQFAPDLVARTKHLTHGIVRLAGGEKMSSRKGNILRAIDVLEAAKIAATEAGNPKEEIVLGAVKYAFLKHGIGGDIHYDPNESVAIVGNSGPYLQYAHARACSILAKSEIRNPKSEINQKLETGERTLVKKLGEYAEIVDRAVTELMPHHVCTYLYELAQEFNRFYETNRVIGDEREEIRLYLVSSYAETLKKGLSILGVHAPEQM